MKTKISKNVGILFWASHFLDGQSLKETYLSFIRIGLNNCYVAWSGNTKTELGKILKKQKRGVLFITKICFLILNH